MPEIIEQTGAQGILSALDLSLANDPTVYIMGEGVTDPGGIFGTTIGLREKYGSKRVIECPLSENGFTGIAIGSAMMGQRPIVIHQRVEFCLLAMEQIVNNAAKAHYVSGGFYRVPLVIRLVVGRGWGQGPLHSQSLESMFAYIPGLKVVIPSTAGDCKGMLLSAIEDNNPVVFLEHRWVHYVKGEIPVGYVKTPLDGPRQHAQGKEITIVANSYPFLETLRVVELLETKNCTCDLFDLRIARPLQLDRIYDSVRKTGRLLVVDTGWKTLGLGSEIVARVTERCFKYLKAPPRRLGLPDQPTPSSRSLASTYYVKTEDIAGAICNMVGIADSVSKDLLRSLSLERQRIPFDVPHPSFQGPF